MKPLTYIAKVQPRLAKYNAGRYIDGWAHNPYWARKSPFASAFKAPSVGIGNMKDVFRQLDRSPVTRRRAVEATKLAYETMPAERKNGVSLANQANYMADAMGIAAKTNRVPLFIWYVMTDPARRPTGSRAC